jgi:hypothetical protein
MNKEQALKSLVVPQEAGLFSHGTGQDCTLRFRSHKRWWPISIPLEISNEMTALYLGPSRLWRVGALVGENNI